MEMKRIGQVEAESGQLLIVDHAYVVITKPETNYASVLVYGHGTYPLYEFEHEGVVYAACPIRPAHEAKTWEAAIQYAVDRQQGARKQAGEGRPRDRK